MKEHSIDLMGYVIYKYSVKDIKIAEKTTVINTLNAFSYVVARKDEEFRNALKHSDILVADGFPVVLAAKILGKIKIHKIAGEDIFYHMLSLLQENKGSCFFLGSSELTLNKIKTRLNKEYSNIKAGFYSPPYKSHFSDEDSKIMIQKINEFKPLKLRVILVLLKNLIK